MFIVLEGIDGCGKTTQMKRLAVWLGDKMGSSGVTLTREPGGWQGGELVRELLLGGGLSTTWSEFFAFMMDRCEHVARVVSPALARGECVLCDRYVQSTLAYQVLSDPEISGHAASYMTSLAEVIGLPVPDRVCFLDIEPDTARNRLEARDKSDSFDARGRDFFARVREGYYRLMSLSPDLWIKIDASASEDAVFEDLTRRLGQFFISRAEDDHK
jgi:dTMP kinase